MINYSTENMRRKDKQIQDKAIIDEILTKSHICRSAFHDGEYPYIVPMNYGYKDNALFFHCATEGKKIDLIKKNPKVCFEIELSQELITGDSSCKWTTKYRSIIGYGTFEIISDPAEKRAGIDIVMQQHGKQDNSYSDKMIDKILILKLNIESLSGKQSGGWK